MLKRILRECNALPSTWMQMVSQVEWGKVIPTMIKAPHKTALEAPRQGLSKYHLLGVMGIEGYGN